MENPNDYLHDLPRITDPAAFLATFTDFIAVGPGVDETAAWTTHVAAHPPLATLVFWSLDQVGLGGGFWAGVLCVLGASAVCVALPVTLRELGAQAAARRIVPFLALFPGAVWMAVSADGLFAGVAISGLALVCRGAMRGKLPVSLAGGVLLGVTVFLSYGLLLMGIVVALAIVLTAQQRGARAVLVPWLVATAGAVTGRGGALRVRLQLVHRAGPAPDPLLPGDREPATLLLLRLGQLRGLADQLLPVARRRSGPFGGDRERAYGATWTQERVVALLALSGVAMALVADATALSKAETERIWLTFGVIAASSFALLRGRWATWGLVACGIWALAEKHLLNT